VESQPGFPAAAHAPAALGPEDAASVETEAALPLITKVHRFKHGI
jgi:hypothetical protein